MRVSLPGLLGLTLIAMTAQAQEKIIFDTDSGFFGDDGGALVMVARSEISILGVTTVAGNVWPVEGAAYMLRLLDLLHRPEIPVLVGARAPLLHTSAMAAEETRRWGPLQYQGAFTAPPADPASITRRRPDPRGAVDFLIQAIDHSPGQVTVLALGPMTNLAIALRLRPDLEAKIGRLVFMGGAVKAAGNTNRTAEFNFWFDPEAAQAVLRSAVARKVMFGLDICNHAPFGIQLFREIAAAKTPVTELFRQSYGDVYPGFERNPRATAYLWDELAAGYLIDPGFVTSSETQYLDVDVRFGPDYGAVIPLDRKLAPRATPVQVMLNLDAGRARKLYTDLMTGRRQARNLSRHAAEQK